MGWHAQYCSLSRASLVLRVCVGHLNDLLQSMVWRSREVKQPRNYAVFTQLSLRVVTRSGGTHSGSIAIDTVLDLLISHLTKLSFCNCNLTYWWHWSNGPFVLTGHMVQNPPYWMAKKPGILQWDIENKGKPSLTGWTSFVFESAAFFCHQYGGLCTTWPVSAKRP